MEQKTVEQLRAEQARIQAEIKGLSKTESFGTLLKAVKGGDNETTQKACYAYLAHRRKARSKTPKVEPVNQS